VAEQASTGGRKSPSEAKVFANKYPQKLWPLNPDRATTRALPLPSGIDIVGAILYGCPV